MNSRTALALLTAAGLGLTGVATANAASESSPSNAAASPTTTPTSPVSPTTGAAAPADPTDPTDSATPVSGTPVSGTAVTVTQTVTATPVTVVVDPQGLSSKLVVANQLTDGWRTFFNILNALIAVTAGAVQIAAVLVELNPRFKDQLRSFFN